MYEFLVYSPEGVRLGVLQHVESVQWAEYYQAPGEVKLTAGGTPENMELLVCGNRLWARGHAGAAVVASVRLRQDGREKRLEVRARGAEALLETRVVMAGYAAHSAEEGMYGLYTANRRGLPMGVAAPKGYARAAENMFEWGSVLQAVTALAEVSGLGFRAVFDPESGAEIFEVYAGTDRTQPSSAAYVGYLGDDIGNLTDVRLVLGSREGGNTAIVAGEETQGALRAVRTVSTAGGLFGEARRELFVDAKSVKRTVQKAVDTGHTDAAGSPVYRYERVNLTDAEYNAALDAFGMEKLAAQLPAMDVQCGVKQEGIAYGVHYFLGDTLPVKPEGCGLILAARVSGATTVYEPGGQTVNVRLSDFRIQAEG